MTHQGARDRMAVYVMLGFVFSVLVMSYFVSTSSPNPSNYQAATRSVASKAELTAAISSAQPGDIIQITGTIEGKIIITKNGTQAAPITIKGGVIRGGGTGRMIEVRDSNYLVFDGIYMDATGFDSAVYMLNSDNNFFKNNTIKNAGGECFRMKAGSQHNTLLSNTIQSCGRTKFTPPASKNGEGIYIGTAPEQISRNVEEAAQSSASDKSGYMANPDNSNLNLIKANNIQPAYPENTKGNECVDIKEGARDNLVIGNICAGQMDKNSGGMESRGENNIFAYNQIMAITCGAGIRLGGDDKQTQGVGNWILWNNFQDYNNANATCLLSVNEEAEKFLIHGAVKVEAPNQGYMCGNTAYNTNLVSGTFKEQINTTEFTGACDQARIDAYLAGKEFGVIGSGTPTITVTISPTITTTVTTTTSPTATRTPTPTKTPTPTLSPMPGTLTPTSTQTPTPSPTGTGGPCPKKKNGDANCKKDQVNGILQDVSLTDFEIWRKEFFAGCSQANIAACAPEEDNDTSSLMDANFDYPGSGYTNTDTKVGLSDFEVWRNGYFSANNASTPTPTPSTMPPTATPTSGSLGCSYPSQILNLTNWKITLPVIVNDSNEVPASRLSDYSIDPWFKVNSGCNGVQFRAHTSSNTTTSNSSYPRSELREMKDNGQNEAKWSSTSGTHTMIVDEAITAVPTGKKHVVAAQIHDSNDDVMTVRLEYPKLFIDHNGTDGPILDANYTLGKRFTVKFVVSAGKTAVYYNNSSAPIETYARSYSGAYFKVGAYTQSNCTEESNRNATCSISNFGEVNVYSVSVTHQ